MNIIESYVYTEDEFEEIQKNFNGKAEFDNGGVFLSSNTSISHNRIKGKLLASLNNFVKGSDCETFDEQIEVIFRNEEEVYKYKPDVFVMCGEKKTKGESFIDSPILIFEIISKSTASHDYITKLAVYQKFKVLEYNIVEQSGKIIQYVLEDDKYVIKDVYKNDDLFVSESLKGFKVKLSEIF